MPQNFKLGKFGKMMVEMLPQDLAFTVFVPSEEAFKRDLLLSVNDSLRPEKFNDTYAIITRILGFSAVPRSLSSVDVPFHELVSYDSLSGFSLHIAKDLDGMLVVNRIRSEIVDVRKRKIVMHIMEGVIMDADFEQSVVSDDSENDWVYAVLDLYCIQLSLELDSYGMIPFGGKSIGIIITTYFTGKV